MTDAVRRQAKRAFVWLFVAALLVVAGGLIYFGTPLHGTQAGLDGVANDPAIALDQADGGYVLQPATGDSDVGLVFYPGGRVHPDAYVASLAPLVREANATVVIPKLPLNLAVLDQGAAGPLVGQYAPEKWVVGGHSLGGVMACRFAASNPDRVAGVMLFASYCDRDVSDAGMAALSVTGAADTVLSRGQYRANLDKLPADAVVRELPGLNHTQFGDYRGQAGDAPSGTPYDVAHRRLANVTVPWLETVAGLPSKTVSARAGT